jgi:carboxypeptidase PM20D1
VLKAAAVVVSAVLLLVGVLVVRTISYGAGPAAAAPAPDITRVDSGAVRRLSEAVRIPTVTQFNAPADIPQFLRFHDLLRRSFPRVHARLTREVVDSGSLVYTWRGTDTTLAPVLLMGHMDVVPVEPGTEKNWTHPAFSGAVADGMIWGRGTLDDKISVMGLMEAAEALLAAGYTPRRTLLFSFGHNEEGGGATAARVAALFKSRGIAPWFVMDEGGAAGDGLLPGVAGVVAVVGIAEKGYVSLRLTAAGDGGHSSMPPRETAVSIIGDAVSDLQETQLPARLDGATLAMFNAIGPSMPFSRRLVFANLWLFKPVLARLMAMDRTSNAMVRTTTAATMISGGIKDNVVPASASAIVNFRLMPGDSLAWLMRRVNEIVDDTRVTVELVEDAGREASAVSPDTTEGFRIIAGAIRDAMGAGLVAPYLVVGGTDARNFELVSRNVYRFAPIMAGGATMTLIHSTNERVAVDNYLTAVRFYRLLIERSTR